MKRALWVMAAALVVVVIMNINLAMELSDLRSTMTRAEPVIEAEVAHAEERLEETVEAARESTDIEAVQADVEALERAVFGARLGTERGSRTPAGLRAAFADLKAKVEELRLCFNGSVKQTIDSLANAINTGTGYVVYTC